MKNQIKQNENNCDRQICNRTDLLTEAGFMNKADIDEKCLCLRAKNCKALIDLLTYGKRLEAERIINKELNG